MTKKLKKPIAFLTVFAMLLSVLLYFPEGTFGGFGLGVRASAVALEVPDGSGSSYNPYLINTAGKLYWFANYVNENSSHRGACARLTDDIVVNSNVLDGSGNLTGGSFEPWTPIGSESITYCGIFEGNGHTISGLYFDTPGAENVGLFGVVGTGFNTNGTISYVGIVDSYFNGGNNVGSICGKADSGTTVKGCFSMGSVSGTSNVGGIFGSADITVENCCYPEGRVFGATASDAALALSVDKFTSGEVAYLLNKYPYAPFWGQKINVDNCPKPLTFDLDGLCTNKVYYADGIGYHNHASEYVACDDCGTIAATKPTLNNNNYIENKDYYEITNKNELYWFALHANCGAGIKSLAILKNDIILNENVLDNDRNPNPGPFYEWTPIGTPERIFAGVFEGGYRVSGLYINKPTDDYLGLFGCTDSYERDSGIRTTSVRWVGIIDSYVCGNNYVGGLVGYYKSALENCYSTAKVVANTYSDFPPLIGGGTGCLSDCAYISDTPRGYGRTAAQFASGDAAYIISEEGTRTWGQNLSGDNPDPLPVHLTEANRVYYTDGIYHNHNAAVSDYCSLCKTLVAQEPNIDSSTGEYEISNRAELLWFAEYVNAGNYTANAVLTADIVVNDKVFDDDGNVLPDLLTIPVMGSYTVTSITKDNPFLGSFKGNGHTISGLYYNETSTNRIGLIGYAGSSAQISGVRITNSYVKGAKSVGAVCGLNAGGTISECSTDGCVITGTDIGGICGWNERSATGGTITNCFNASKVIGEGAGGICGFNNNGKNNVSKCVNIGILNDGAVYTCGTGTCTDCYVLTKNPLAAPSDKSIASSIVGLTDDNFISTNGFGSEWTKTANDTANKKLYFPRLAAFSGNDISVEYTPKLVIEDTNTTPIYYKDDLTFTFDALLTLANGEEYSAVSADTVFKLSDIDFKIVHNGNPDDFDRVSTSIDYRNMRLALKISGHDCGYITYDTTTNKVIVVITEDINAGSHSFDITYKGTALPVFTGLSVSQTVDIQKGTPIVPALPSATDISYGEQLAESELKDSNGNTDAVWQWKDETIVPKVSETTQQIVTKNAVDDVNYDYSGVDGYNASTHLITKDITLTINRAVPNIVVTATPAAAIPGATVTVSAAISNPNNSALTDLPDAEFSYVIGTGSEQAITNGSFVIPTGIENGTVITIIARTSETANYAQATDRSTTVTVTDCTHSAKKLKYNENSHWYHCDACGADLDVEAHRGGTATCTNKAVCTVCDQEHGTVDPNNHTNIASTWSSDATGHWHECSDCHANVDKAAHVSSGPATVDKAETCTVCDYVITPKLGAVADPVILPAEQTFKDSLEITITCGTEGADIYYTLDGTTPTVSEENRYTGAITITQTTTVKAFAVKFGMVDSEVATATFTKKSSGGGGGGGGGTRPSTPTDPSKPSIGGSEKSWADIAAYLATLPIGSEVTIELNGNTTVPVEVIKVIDDRKLKVTFVYDSVRSWKTDGAEITAPAEADLSFLTASDLKTDALRGITGIRFTMNGTNLPTDLQIAFIKAHAGKFANLYKSVDGKLVFVTCAKLSEDGKVILPDVTEKGDYVAMLCEFSDRPGDMNNDGVMNSFDAAAILVSAADLGKGENPEISDLNGDGRVNAKDAAIILQRVAEAI